MELKRMVQTLAQQYESIHQECKANSTGRRLVACGDNIAKRTIPNVIQQPVHSTTVAPAVIVTTKATTKASVDVVATEDATTTKAPRSARQDTKQDKLSAGKLSAHVSIVFVWMQVVILYNVLQEYG